MNMKKLLGILLLLAALLAMPAALAAPQCGQEGSTHPECEIDWENVYYDEKEHWYQCKHCGAEKQYERHWAACSAPDVCDVCQMEGYDGPHVFHDYAYGGDYLSAPAWKYAYKDEYTHVYVCSWCGNSDIELPHEWKDDSGVCYRCLNGDTLQGRTPDMETEADLTKPAGQVKPRTSSLYIVRKPGDDEAERYQCTYNPDLPGFEPIDYYGDLVLYDAVRYIRLLVEGEIWYTDADRVNFMDADGNVIQPGEREKVYVRLGNTGLYDAPGGGSKLYTVGRGEELLLNGERQGAWLPVLFCDRACYVQANRAIAFEEGDWYDVTHLEPTGRVWRVTDDMGYYRQPGGELVVTWAECEFDLASNIHRYWGDPVQKEGFTWYRTNLWGEMAYMRSGDVQPMPAQTGYVCVEEWSATVRNAPAGRRILARLGLDEILPVYGEAVTASGQQWLPVGYDDSIGYVQAKHVVPCDKDGNYIADPETCEHNFAGGQTVKLNDTYHVITCRYCKMIEEGSQQEHTGWCSSNGATRCQSCGEEDVTLAEIRHSWTEDVHHDKYQHGKMCLNCGIVFDYEDHVGYCESDPNCLYCGMQNVVIGEYIHDGAQANPLNETHHSWDCARCGKHQYNSEHIASCSREDFCILCEAGDIVPDYIEHAGEWQLHSDQYTCWYECSACNKEIKGTRGEHIANCSNPGRCDTCGYAADGMAVGYHGEVDRNEFFYDGEYHWFKCLDCGQPAQKEKHLACCTTATVCDYCMMDGYTGGNVFHDSYYSGYGDESGEYTWKDLHYHTYSCGWCGELVDEALSHRMDTETGTCYDCGGKAVCQDDQHVWGYAYLNEKQCRLRCDYCGMWDECVPAANHVAECANPGVCAQCAARVEGIPIGYHGELLMNADDTHHYETCRTCMTMVRSEEHFVLCGSGETTCNECDFDLKNPIVRHVFTAWTDIGNGSHKAACINPKCNEVLNEPHFIDCETMLYEENPACICGKTGVTDVRHSAYAYRDANMDRHWDTCILCFEKLRLSWHYTTGVTEAHTCTYCGTYYRKPSGYARVTTGNLNLRKEADRSAEVLTQIPLDAIVPMYDQPVNDGTYTWLCVRYNGYTGYVMSQLTQPCQQSGLPVMDTLIIPDGVEIIREKAFYGDADLQQVVLPNGVTTIESKAFAGSGVQHINLPSTLIFIAGDAFEGCTDLTVTVEPADTRAYSWALEKGYID